MGVAAYNRGSAAISRDIDASIPSLNDLFMRDMTELSASEATESLFAGDTVIRLQGGKVYLMNKKETGWSSSSREYRGLRDVAKKYRLVFNYLGYDKHSSYVAVTALPDPEKRTNHITPLSSKTRR